MKEEQDIQKARERLSKIREWIQRKISENARALDFETLVEHVRLLYSLGRWLRASWPYSYPYYWAPFILVGEWK